MAIYNVENQWGGNNAPWNEGGIMFLGSRNDQNVVDINIESKDSGKTFEGTITYAGEGPIGFRGAQVAGNNYSTEVQWGGNTAPWHPNGTWLIGAREGQFVASMKVSGNTDLTGQMTYLGEGPIGFKATQLNGSAYQVENQWGGNNAPWHNGGIFVLSNRTGQNPVAFDITSNDGGETFSGSMTYAGEGPVGFKGVKHGTNSYKVSNQWGGNEAPWHDAGIFVIGCRVNQNVVAMKVNSSDNGKSFSGEMTYKGEGPIGFKGSLAAAVAVSV